MRLLAATLAAALLVTGSIEIVTQKGEALAEPEEGEVLFGQLLGGTTLGLNNTNASVSVTGSLLSLLTTNVLTLDNANGTGTYHARIVLTESSGIANLVGLTIGIDNGTKTPMVTGTLGSLTQTEGIYVELPAGSSSTIYLTQRVSLSTLVTLQTDVYIADDADAGAFYVMKAEIRIV